MAKGFGKIKRLMKKPTSPKFVKAQPDGNDTTPATTPLSAHGVLKPLDVNYVQSSDITELKRNGDHAPLLAGQQQQQATGADDVLEGILQDLNITQLAVDAGRTDTVSEYSGGSAKSVESDSDEDSDEESDEEETDADEEETDGGEETDEKKKSSVGDRVAAVVAAAEEIRKKKRGGGGSPKTMPGSGRSTPATEPGSKGRRGSKSGRSTPVDMREPEQAASKSSKASAAMQASSRSSSKSLNKKKKSPPRDPSATKAAKNMLPPSGKSKSRRGGSTPQFSPGEKSFDDEADQTQITTEISEEGTYDEETVGEENTLGDADADDNNTLGTDGLSYEDDRGTVGNSMSQSQNSGTFTEDDNLRTTKKTVMNKDIIIHCPGGPSSLVVRAMYYTPLPATPEDIIIKVEASTVSFRDCLLRRGIGIDKASFPFVPGCEVVGTISNVGKAARAVGYRVGDRVVGMTRRGGGNGYYAKLNMSFVSPVLSSVIDPADAVVLVDVYMTAYQALRVGKKDGTPLTEANVLITDGFSPIGQAAVALAKLEGANVYVTTTESRQDEYMKTLGVKCLPMASSKWLHKLKGKMDIVIDNTCFDSYDSSWKALNPNGVLVCTGYSSIYSFQDYGAAAGGGCGCDAFGDMRDYQAKWASFKSRYMMSQTKFHDLHESFQKDPKKFQQELKYLCFLVESGMLKPKIAERVSIEEVPDAQRYLETGKANGTIVCLP